MSTDESYVGKGDSAISNPQTGQNSPQIQPTADNRSDLTNLPPPTSSGVQEYRGLILDRVGRFMTDLDPVPSVNTILLEWLRYGSTALSNTHAKHHVCEILNLVTFLVELREFQLVLDLELESIRQQQADAQEGGNRE